MFNTLKQINIEAPIHKKLLKIIGNNSSAYEDSVLILENSNSLYDAESINNFRTWMVENKIKHNVLYSVDELPLDYLKEVIRGSRIIAFQTTGTYEIVNVLKDYVSYLSREGYNLKVIECYINEPNFQILPKDCDARRLEVWSLDAFDPMMEEWEIEKLKKR